MPGTLTARLESARAAKAKADPEPKRYPNFVFRNCHCRTLQVCKHGN